MSFSFLQLPKAQKEILKAWEWYEEAKEGLGDRFIEDLHRKIKLVQENPLHYPIKGKYREAQTDKFPYLIVYKIDIKNNMIVITSVFHTSRHPKQKLK